MIPSDVADALNADAHRTMRITAVDAWAYVFPVCSDNIKMLVPRTMAAITPQRLSKFLQKGMTQTEWTFQVATLSPSWSSPPSPSWSSPLSLMEYPSLPHGVPNSLTLMEFPPLSLMEFPSLSPMEFPTLSLMEFPSLSHGVRTCLSHGVPLSISWSSNHNPNTNPNGVSPTHSLHSTMSIGRGGTLQHIFGTRTHPWDGAIDPAFYYYDPDPVWTHAICA